MEYPKPRYEKPVFMDPDNRVWTPVEGAPGVSEKFLGVFTEARTRVAIVRIEPGATFATGGKRSLFFVREGRGTVEGGPFRMLTTVYTEKGETASFTATETAILLHVDFPDLELLERTAEDRQLASAAE